MKYLIFSLCLFLILPACGNEKNNTGETENQQISLLKENPESDSAAIPSQNVPANFTGKTTADAIAIFGDEFKSEKTIDIDRIPSFKTAKASVFLKFIRLNPISNEYGGKIIPRITFKAWQFSSHEELIKVFEDYLNSTESSDSSIHLGENVKAYKSPPYVCVITQNEIYIMQTSCVYSGNELEALIGRFFDFFPSTETKYRFRVHCGAGKLEYFTK